MEHAATLQAGGKGCAKAVGGAFPLNLAGTGCSVQIQQIRGNHETRHHLEHMGFVENAKVTVVNQCGGNLIAEVKGARIALSCQMASKMLVTPA